jgi:ABC-type sugar transport system permease subunit
MASITQLRPSAARIAGLPWVIPVCIVWYLLIVVGSFLAGSAVYDQENFYNLGEPVKYFAIFVAFIPTLMALYSTYGLLTRRPNGRYIGLTLNYFGAVVSAAYLLHLWDVYIGFDDAAQALREQFHWLAGMALGYGLFWLAGRFEEGHPARRWLERAALAIALVSFVLLLLLGNALGAGAHILEQYGELSTWGVTAMMLGFGFLSWHLLHLGDYFGETTDQRNAWQGWLMLSPNIIGFLIFFAGPLLLSFYLSFTDSSVGQVPKVIGLSNYADILALEVKTLENPGQRPQAVLSFGYNPLQTVKLFDETIVIGAKDTLFWRSLRNTLVFCLLLVPLSCIPALALSIILNSNIPGMKFFRAIYFLPSVAAVVGTALIWRWLYDPLIGYFNYLIGQGVIFLNSTFGLSLVDPQIQWLTDGSVVLFSIVLLAAWQVVGFNTVLFLAGLQGIPKLLYEAAYVDGANRWEQFRFVTLPLLAPTTFFVVITTVITGLQVFNEPYALIFARPLPVEATTSVYYLYNRGFFRFEFGYASAVAWLLFALIFTITLIQFRLGRSNAYDN